MKLNDKQIDDIARCLGNLAVAALAGAIVGLSGHSPKPLTNTENAWLAIASVVCFLAMVLIRNVKGK